VSGPRLDNLICDGLVAVCWLRHARRQHRAWWFHWVPGDSRCKWPGVAGIGFDGTHATRLPRAYPSLLGWWLGSRAGRGVFGAAAAGPRGLTINPCAGYVAPSTISLPKESGPYSPLFFVPQPQPMSSEILSVLEYMEKEKGISRVDMIATITNALKTAALKGVNSGQI